MRINQYIAKSGYCSRREADRLLADGNVTLNDRPASVGADVKAGDAVKINGRRITPKTKGELVYLAFHKPVGVTTTTDLRRRDNIIAFINYPERIFPVGRLDRDSEGLILLTNDGDIVNRILRAEYGHEKEYEVTVDRPPTSAMLAEMESGIMLDGRMTLPVKIKMTGNRSFRIVLRQGLNRQIRRMCEAVGLQVTKLKRLRIMHVTLGNLKPGTYRLLTPKEMRDMRMLLEQAEAETNPRPPRTPS